MPEQQYLLIYTIYLVLDRQEEKSLQKMLDIYLSDKNPYSLSSIAGFWQKKQIARFGRNKHKKYNLNII